LGCSYSELSIDPGSLPARSEQLGLSFDHRLVNAKNTTLFLHPKGALSEPRYARFVAGLRVKVVNNALTSEVEGQGQLVVSGERLVGMIDAPLLGGAPWRNGNKLRVFAFTLDRDDIGLVHPKTNRLGRPIGLVIAGKETLRPWLAVEVIATPAFLRNSGEAGPSSIPNLMDRLTPSGRDSLRGPSA
jgi:hypothetical protein